MLIGYTGTPRSGKTYSAIKSWYLETLIDNVGKAEPRHIYTNINGLLDESCLFATAEYTGLSIKQICEQVHIVNNAWFLNIWDEFQENSLIIADEAHKFWCSREWKSFPEQGRDFIAESGQYGVDIVWISQTAGSVEKWITSRTEFIYSALNLGLLGFSKRFVLRTRDGLSMYSNLKPTYHKIEQNVFNCYKSYQVEPKNMKLKSASMFGLPMKFAFLFVFVFFSYNIYNIFSDDETIQKASATIQPSTVDTTETKGHFPFTVGFNDSQEDNEPQELSENIDVWFAGVIYISALKNIVLLEDDKGNQFNANKLGLNFLVNKQAKVLHNDTMRVYKIGDSFEISRELYSTLNLKPARKSSNPNRVMRTYNMPNMPTNSTTSPRYDGLRSYHTPDGFKTYM